MIGKIESQSLWNEEEKWHKESMNKYVSVTLPDILVICFRSVPSRPDERKNGQLVSESARINHVGRISNNEKPHGD